MNIAKTLTALAAAAITTVAIAAVTFNPDTGAGFVGKGDVQLAFGWNNNQLQNNALGVGFKYIASADYDVVCVWTTGEGNRGEHTHRVTKESTSEVISTVLYDARSRNQINGFNLTGLSSTWSSAIPQVNDPCLGNGADAKVESVVQTGFSAGSLYATFGGNRVALN